MSLHMARLPKIGPMTRVANAQRHPTTSTTPGISRIETSVSRNPMEVCAVRSVPTYSPSPSSLTADENCAESATMVNPQIRATAVTM